MASYKLSFTPAPDSQDGPKYESVSLVDANGGVVPGVVGISWNVERDENGDPSGMVDAIVTFSNGEKGESIQKYPGIVIEKYNSGAVTSSPSSGQAENTDGPEVPHSEPDGVSTEPAVPVAEPVPASEPTSTAEGV